MGDLFSSLGIDWKILVAQIINFAILVFVFKLFLYKPILKILDARRLRLEEDKKKSENLSHEVDEIKRKEEEILTNARTESQKIIKNAEVSASKVKEDIVKNAHTEATQIVKKGEREVKESSEKAKEGVLKEVGSLVALAIERTIGDVIDEKAKEKLQKQAVEYAVNYK